MFFFQKLKNEQRFYGETSKKGYVKNDMILRKKKRKNIIIIMIIKGVTITSAKLC
jgi:hypothetical protein